MKNLFFILAIAPILSSCRAQKDTLYGKCPPHYFACIQILLKADGEFEYFRFYDVGGQVIVKGQWQTRRDTVILNTYEQQESRLDTVIESTVDNKKNTIRFEGGFFGYLQVDSSRFDANRIPQELEFDAPLKNITFCFYDDEGRPIPVHYTVKNPSANHLLVKVRHLTSNLVIKDEKFIKTRKGLKYIDEPYIKKKTAMKNKQW
jgi:hypothetical protein